VHRPDPYSADRETAAAIALPAHNAGPPQASQWQAPKPGEPEHTSPADHDLDLVEQEFYRAIVTSADPTSLLRLARVPFVADIGDGKLMRLLSVAVSDEIEVGAITPCYGGSEVAYHPVPASRVNHSRNLRFVYHTPDGIRSFSYAEIRGLPDLV
jgi:hypothetical protein